MPEPAMRFRIELYEHAGKGCFAQVETFYEGTPCPATSWTETVATWPEALALAHRIIKQKRAT